MGDLIVMARSPGSPARFIKPKLDDRPADILFFTGVRYYRMPDAVPATTKTRRRRVAVASKAVRLDCQA